MILISSPARAQQAQSKRKELGHIQHELESTRREIEEFKTLEQSLNKELQKLESRNVEARKKIAQLQRGMKLAQEKKNQLKTRLGALGQASGFWKSALEADLQGYAAALASRNEAFGTSDLWAEAYRRAALSEKIDLLGSLRGVSRKTEMAEAETRRKTQELASKSLKVEQEQQTRQQEYRQKKEAIAQTQEKVAAATARAKELEESAAALTRLIRSLGKGKRYKKTGTIARLEVPKNSLPWPAAGSVVKPFGRQRNPDLNTWVISQGILLATEAGVPVAAIERGRVIFSGPFKSYGRVLILDHGGNFFSIYGELGEMLKTKGADVRGGEVIAKAGARGDKGSLYLEIRRGTEALDPLVWLQHR